MSNKMNKPSMFSLLLYYGVVLMIYSGTLGFALLSYRGSFK